MHGKYFNLQSNYVSVGGLNRYAQRVLAILITIVLGRSSFQEQTHLTGNTW